MGFTKTPDSLELNLEIALTLTSLAHMSQNQLDVRYVARLARLELSDEEIAEFQPQLNAVMEHVEALKELNIKGIEPTAHAAPVFDRMRDDEPQTPLPVESVMQNAPDQSQNQIRVPKVVADA